MSLKQRISEDLKAAMRGGEAQRRDAMRLLLAPGDVMIDAGASAREIVESWAAPLEAFRRLRGRYLIYR